MDDYSRRRHETSLHVNKDPTGDCCYDADTSCSSVDYNMSVHDEVCQATLHRGFGEAAARGAKASTSNFYPMNEETVFMEHPQPHALIGHHASSGGGHDNWMLYNNSSSSSSSNNSNNNSSDNSSGSGDEYCYGQHIVNSEDTSSDLDISVLPMSTECPLKRNRHRQRRRLRLYEGDVASTKDKVNADDDEDNDDDDDEDMDDDDDCTLSMSKRFKVKGIGGSSSKLASQARLDHVDATDDDDNGDEDNDDEPSVDVRMIDFAHTTIGHNHATSTATNLMVHQGPDCGFLTGLDSLKRLLQEILAEG